jgi:ubiquinone/menaquinone biosynthesis C-methylase UbiE
MKNQVESFYDNVAKDYSSHEDRVCDKIIEHFIIDNIPKNKPLKILDVGGGIGRFSEVLINMGHDVLLVELSNEMLNKAKIRLRKHSNIKFLKSSITNMNEIKSDSFDIVLAINAILDYCDDYNLAMKEVYRVLKKDGTFMGTVNNRFIYSSKHELVDEDYNLFEKSMKFGDRYIIWGEQKEGHISHEFTQEELKKSLKKNKFEIIKLLGIFNLRDKYELDKLNNPEDFIKLQIKYADKEEYLNNSQDFLFVAKK